MLYFDVTRLVEWEGRYTGMEVVAYELASAIHKSGGHLVYFVPGKGFADISNEVTWANRSLSYPHVRRGSLKQMVRKDPKKVAGELRRRWTLDGLRPVLFNSSDTFFTSDGLWDRQDYINAVLYISKQKAKIVHIVHDIVPIVVPHLVHDYVTVAMASYFQQVSPCIDRLIAISENTKKDFMEYFGEYCKPNLEKVVFHHGDNVPDVKPSMPDRLKGVKDFILCVGTIEIRKNHMLLYQTYRLAAERDIKLPPLVIIGRDGWLADQALKLMRDDPVTKENLIFLGPAPDSEMVWCYQNCLFTIMPSLYEGWGLPVAQSMYYGKVAATSTAGPLPEVGGDLNVYFSPFSVDECLEVVQLLLSPKERQAREARIKKLYTTTTWSESISGVVSGLAG